MANTILILGNGFDIAMGRKTKYIDFIEFEKQLFSNPDERLQEFLEVKNIRIEKYRDNLYLKFINDNKDKLGENWSNLEIMISQLADAILFFKENSKVLSECIGSDYYPYFNDVLEDTNNYTAKRYVAKVFEDEILDEELDNYKKELFIENLNELFLDQLDLLIELLEIYLSYLDYIDFEIRGIEARPTALDAIRYLSHTYVLNFNYTNTSGYLFGTSDMLTHFIHGRIDLERTFGRINTMVFGIEDKENDVNSDLIPYQKYYQRVVKETGNEFEEFFQPRYRDSDEEVLILISKNIIIFGHSVDPLDKEIFQKCFELAEKGEYLYRFIFTYYDESAKRSIIKNLAIILGKEKLIELTGKRNVVFIQSDDKDGMKDILLP
ncbi:bacteriophage abortive infection AbiH family protein [Streptococcus oralis]|uniref:AbiH family protein n=1 Tax=Streptococcus oralis TaxID=1303 RepID=UPI0022842F8C|nr:AbiH family protein [Streptococcus oralis]MCY7101063.1 bacteriophage abortive infection AbiH family protein [Streptococcus oralis]MDU6557586.1 AbiH family protein [Streptococcus sp.]